MARLKGWPGQAGAIVVANRGTASTSAAGTDAAMSALQTATLRHGGTGAVLLTDAVARLPGLAAAIEAVVSPPPERQLQPAVRLLTDRCIAHHGTDRLSERRILQEQRAPAGVCSRFQNGARVLR